MRIGNVGVIIPQGKERESGHVSLVHGQKYTVQLLNFWHDRRLDAVLTIDGKEMGTYRVDNGGKVVLERPVHDTGCFTFYKADTEEYAKAAGGDVKPDLRGLLTVVFRPEKKQHHQLISRTVGVPKGAFDRQGSELYAMPMNAASDRPVGGAGGQSQSLGFAPREREEKTSGGIQLPGGREPLSAGVTGLSGRSSQRFLEVANLEYDADEEVTINLRLAAVDDGPRPLTSASPKSNPVPEPVA